MKSVGIALIWEQRNIIPTDRPNRNCFILCIIGNITPTTEGVFLCFCVRVCVCAHKGVHSLIYVPYVCMYVCIL